MHLKTIFNQVTDYKPLPLRQNLWVSRRQDPYELARR
jgi:hypothetical protein